MRKRRSRRNAWFGKPRLHSKAAKRGWRGRRRSRSVRLNAGSMVANTTRSLKAGFDPNILKRATAILAGNVSTTWYVDQIGSRVSMVRRNPYVEAATLLALSGANAMVVGKVLKQPKYASDVFIGGILAGVTRVIKAVAPGMFNTCGLRGDMEGLSDWTIGPQNVMNAFSARQPFMNGMDAYPSPAAPLIGTHGLADSAVVPQVNYANAHPNMLDGLANLALAEELAQYA